MQVKSKSNFTSDIRIHDTSKIQKNTIFNNRNKDRNKNNYNSSNQKQSKIFFNVRGAYMYSRAKPRGITLNIIQ